VAICAPGISVREALEQYKAGKLASANNATN
jgi:hypothetical protein